MYVLLTQYILFIPKGCLIIRNHASADLTIKKLMEENKVALSDSLVKAAAWTHNTSVNRLGYSPLQLVTGQAVMV